MSNDKILQVHEFFTLLDQLGNKALKDEWSFYPESDIYDKPDNVNPIAISYRINDRTYAKDITARKPIYKKDNKEDQQVVKSQMFDSTIEFGIWGKDYIEINNTREWLEKFLLRQIESFKEEGVLKLLFKNQLDDEVISINNNTFTKQRLHYLLRTEREVKVPYENIEKININFDDFENKKRTKNYY